MVLPKYRCTNHFTGRRAVSLGVRDELRVAEKWKKRATLMLAGEFSLI